MPETPGAALGTDLLGGQSLSATIPQTPAAGPQDSGTVRVTLAGHGQDLLKLALYLEGVIAGHDPAEVLRDVHLAAIVILSTRGTRGRGNQITMIVQLTEAAG